ncbi:MAG: precorrin-4 C(11)-methyltransferase [Alicyclobacillaceae bacterium]|jgi:precorrin-4/cobalt-precorrin-4 C11-methyltransferase|uniref:precorrin-4 C(11)-methyltransferase n=1 Tax=Alicyclobacillus sp. SP_1 TaxID=2942475 RepID=UPI0021570D26|nr:precorrin-4 C(11)-methyltransferase [Alicyclobacillus sp. SP_1]MCY0887358.1 precorrin-4 C(11)-methyltransferase [Alicyclobacillaceae bacterium]
MNSGELTAKVYIVGAGPGAPDLITVRGQRILQQADVLLYTDSLVPSELVACAKPTATVYKTAGMALDEMVGIMVEGVQSGHSVARVHTGDPSIFGAILEQMVLLRKAGVAYEVVPGVSSVFAAAAAVGAELTVPDLTQTVILTRVGGRTPMPDGESLRELATHRCTMAFYLSATLAKTVVQELTAAGWPPETPVAVVQKATWPEQKIIRTNLSRLVRAMGDAHISNHAILLVGFALDEALLEQDQHRSKLYDETFTHRYRKGVIGND